MTSRRPSADVWRFRADAPPQGADRRGGVGERQSHDGSRPRNRAGEAGRV